MTSSSRWDPDQFCLGSNFPGFCWELLANPLAGRLSHTGPEGFRLGFRVWVEVKGRVQGLTSLHRFAFTAVLTAVLTTVLTAVLTAVFTGVRGGSADVQMSAVSGRGGGGGGGRGRGEAFPGSQSKALSSFWVKSAHSGSPDPVCDFRLFCAEERIPAGPDF